MKSTFTLTIISCLLFTPAVAQYDLSVSNSFVSSGPFNSIPFGLQSAVEIEVFNAGNMTIPAGANVDLTYQFSTYLFNETFTLSDSLPIGASAIYNFGAANILTFGDTFATVMTTATVSISGDTNLTNDTLNNYYIVNGSTNNDWITSSVAVINPSNLDGFDIDNGTNIPPALSQVDISFVNNSEISFVKNSPFEYSISLGAETYLVNANLSAGAVNYGDTVVRTITNQAILPALPDSVGDYSLCATALMPNDLENSNDEACFDFTIVDNFDPTDPINWPQGISETELSIFKVNAANGALEISGIQQPTRVRISDINGRLLLEQGLNNDGSIAFDAPMGIYVVHLSDNRTFETAKLLIQP